MATRPTLEVLRSITNYTQSFRWYVEVEKFPSVVSGYSSDDINYRAESIELPAMTNPPTEVNIRGHKRKQPGIGNYNGVINLTAVETVDVVIRNFIADWREAHWRTRDGSSGLTEYKLDLESTWIIALLDSLDQPIWFYKLIGCQLEGADPGGTPGGESADPFKPIINLGYEYFIEGASL